MSDTTPRNPLLNAENDRGYCPHGEPYDDKDPCPDDPPQYAESVRLYCTYCGTTFTVPAEFLSMVAVVCACGISRSHPEQFDGGDDSA